MPDPIPVPEPVASDLQRCLEDQTAVSVALAQQQQTAAGLAQAQTDDENAKTILATSRAALASSYATLQADLAQLFNQQITEPLRRR